MTLQEIDDAPTILGQLNPPASADDQKKSDEDRSNCELSDNVWAYVERQPNATMKWVRAARTHCAALSVCEDGFPGYARREVLVRRVMRRATTVICYPIAMDTTALKELVSATLEVQAPDNMLTVHQILGSIDELCRRLKTAAEIVVIQQYIPISSGPNKKLSATEAFAMVSQSVVNDNYVYETYDPHGQVSRNLIGVEDECY